MAFVIYAPIAATRYASGTGLHVTGVAAGPGFLASGILSLFMLQSWTLVFWGWNPPSWSISSEAFFYFTFPWLMPRLSKINSRNLLRLCFVLWIISLIAPIYFSIAILGHTPAELRNVWDTALLTQPLLRIMPFLIGIATGIFFLRYRAHSPARVSWLTNAAVILSLAVYTVTPESLGRLAENSLTPVFAVLVYTLAFERGLLGRLLSHPVLVLLGESSYATYLLHTPLWNYMARRQNIAMLFHGHFPTGQPIPGMVTEWRREMTLHEFGVYLVLLVGIAVLTEIYVGKPARGYLKRWFEKRHRRAQAAELAASAS